MATDSPMEMLLNGYHFHDAVTDYLKAGTTEVWRWVNLTVDAHPMHPHLFGMQVVTGRRSTWTVTPPPGTRTSSRGATGR